MYLNNAIVTVGTVTYAMKARKLLNRNGIRSKLVKLDSSKTANGCTYGIEFPANDLYSAVCVLREAGISYNLYQK